MTKKELEVALSIATRNRRELAGAVNEYLQAMGNDHAFEVQQKLERMQSLAQELAK